MEFELVEEKLSGSGIILTLAGRLDAVHAVELKSRLKRLVADGHIHLIVDLTDVHFIDSSGLSALVSGLRAAGEAGGTLRLAGLNEQTTTAFRLTKLDRVLECYPDAAAAQAALPKA
jgi:anti-sigma B factor antagonist